MKNLSDKIENPKKEFEDLVKNRSFSNNLDIDFINQKIRKIGET